MATFQFDPRDEKAEEYETLQSLIDRWEYEIVEFKEAKGQYSEDKIGQYFSAISNEANLAGQQFGWLVLGVSEQKERYPVGTSFKSGDATLLERFKFTISRDTTDGMTFLEIVELFPVYEGAARRVLMFKIPAAASGMHILFDKPDLELETVYLMDQIQKGRMIAESDVKRLQEQNLIKVDDYGIKLVDHENEVIVDGRNNSRIQESSWGYEGHEGYREGNEGNREGNEEMVLFRSIVAFMDESMRDRAAAILHVIYEEPTISIVKIAELTGIPQKTTERYLKQLRDGGVLRREGNTRSGYWTIKRG